MRYFVVILGLLGIFSFNSIIAIAQDNNTKEENTCTQDQLARRGCCSHHSGVCGCSSGRSKCCDGSLSPSCGCKHDSDQSDKKPSLFENAH